MGYEKLASKTYVGEVQTQLQNNINTVNTTLNTKIEEKSSTLQQNITQGDAALDAKIENTAETLQTNINTVNERVNGKQAAMTIDSYPDAGNCVTGAGIKQYVSDFIQSVLSTAY